MTDSERLLQNIHNENPGMSTHFFKDALVDAGKSSYDLLIDEILPNTMTTILDLGCGDGYLLEKVSEVFDVSLIGIDMSSSEIKIACERHIKKHIPFLCGRAQDIPLEDSSVDYVMSHMSIMLMTSLPKVFAEVHRILKNKGKLSFVIPGKVEKGSTYAHFVELLRKHLNDEGVKLKKRFGDLNVRTVEEMEFLLSHSGDFFDISIESYILHLNAFPEILCEKLFYSYDALLLSPYSKKTLRSELIEYFYTKKTDLGITPCSFQINKLTGTCCK